MHRIHTPCSVQGVADRDRRHQKMIAGLTEALASRRAIVDQEAETAEGYGTGRTGAGPKAGKFAGVSFVDKSDTGKTGLVNQGATCYLNSFVQMLCMTPDFCKPLFEWRHDASEHGEERRCLALQLQKLLARLRLTTRGAVATTELTKSFGWEGSEAFVQHGEYDFDSNSPGIAHVWGTLAVQTPILPKRSINALCSTHWMARAMGRV